MKILLHMCCGPCSIYPVDILRDRGKEVMGYFYKDNIHPFTECRKREETLQNYAESASLKVIIPRHYDMEGFIQRIVFRESKPDRCRICYHDRLRSTALTARRGKFDCFTTTLLYSKFQNHDLIKSIGESVARSVDVPFYYHDFRIGWSAGVQASKQLKMYRQPYCGCIYSEKERYAQADSGRSG